MPIRLRVPCPGTPVTLVTSLLYPAEGEVVGATLLLAPGAGAPHTHPFLVDFAGGLARRGIDVVTFNFPYAEAGRRVPDRTPTLQAAYVAAIRTARAHRRSAPMVLGGKSMGGRIASLVAASRTSDLEAVVGLVFLGYPFHPAGRRDARRTAHLPAVGRPMLFVQGSRDPFGTPDEVRAAVTGLADSTVEIVPGGDHSLRVPRTGGAAQPEVDERIRQDVAEWIRERVRLWRGYPGG